MQILNKADLFWALINTVIYVGDQCKTILRLNCKFNK